MYQVFIPPCVFLDLHQLIPQVGSFISPNCETEYTVASMTFTKEAVLDSICDEYTILAIYIIAASANETDGKSTFRFSG